MLAPRRFGARPRHPPVGRAVTPVVARAQCGSCRHLCRRRCRRRSDARGPARAQVQIARLSERIKYLTEHQARNKKDKATERGLVKLANHRRKLLKFLIEDDLEVFEKITAAYGIRTRKIVEESMGVVRRDKSRSNGAMN